MSKLTSLPERALELASAVGGNLRQAVPDAGKWLQTGAALGAIKGGARIAGGFVRRNPVIAVAAVAGAGLLWYAARRKAQRAANGEASGEAIEGSAKRIDARRGESSDVRSARARRTRHARNEASEDGV